MSRPDRRDPEYVAFVHLSNDIARTESEQFVWIDTREEIAAHLWRLGYRRAADVWDATAAEAHSLGWLHDFALSDTLERNPYRTAQQEEA